MGRISPTSLTVAITRAPVVSYSSSSSLSTTTTSTTGTIPGFPIAHNKPCPCTRLAHWHTEVNIDDNNAGDYGDDNDAGDDDDDDDGDDD